MAASQAAPGVIAAAEPGGEYTPSGVRKSPLAFGAGFFGISIFIETFGYFAYFYYVDFLGLSLVSAAQVRSLFSIIDSVDDPLAGLISDHTRSRWGRRRPWLFACLPLLMLSFFLVFSVPEAFRSPRLLLPYMIGIFLVFEIMNTAIGINYSAMFPGIYRTLQERTRTAVFVQGGQVLGVLVGLSLFPILYTRFGFSATAGIYALCGAAFLIVSLLKHREAVQDSARRWADIRSSLGSILADRIFWLYILMMVLTFFATAQVGFALPFYVKYSLHAPASTITLLSGLSIGASLTGMTVWPKLIRTWGLQKVFIFAIMIMGAALASLGAFASMPAAAITATIFGAAVQGSSVCNIILRATLVSRNMDMTGSQNEGLYYGLMNSALRLGGLLQAAAMLLAALLFGYTSGDNPGPRPDLAFRFLISALPAASLVLAVLAARVFFKAYTQKASPTVS